MELVVVDELMIKTMMQMRLKCKLGMQTMAYSTVLGNREHVDSGQSRDENSIYGKIFHWSP